MRRFIRWSAMIGAIVAGSAATLLSGCGTCQGGLMPSDETYVEGCGCVANPDVHFAKQNHCRSDDAVYPTRPPPPPAPDAHLPPPSLAEDASTEDASDADPSDAPADADAGDD